MNILCQNYIRITTYQKENFIPCVVAHNFNSNVYEAEAGGYL